MDVLSTDVPLVVDLDGTLLRTDTLLESLLALARARPARLLALPLWWARGRAHLKRRLAECTDIDAATLPYDAQVLELLRAERARGRHLVLATGADAKIAGAVAGKLGLFDAVLASDGELNLSAEGKRARLVAEFGAGGFDYLGNSARDLTVWAAARHALLAAPSAAVEAAARRVGNVARVFRRPLPTAATYLGAMRLHHWVKNLLVWVPLVAARQLRDPALLLSAAVGMLCFSLAASGIYLINDLLDLRADRRHPHKRQRALASGEIPLSHALGLLPGLWIGAALLGAWLGPPFLLLLGVYVALMVAYSTTLKDLVIVDALVLATGYDLRIEAGALATGLPVSRWLLVWGAALFFGLALLKRYAELIDLRDSMRSGDRLRSYRLRDATPLAVLGIVAACVSVAVLARYAIVELAAPARWPVWLFGAMLLCWVGHLWLQAHRGLIREDPLAYALHDRLSRGFGAATLLLLLVSA